MSSALQLNTFRPGYLLNGYPENRRPWPNPLMRAGRTAAQNARATWLKRRCSAIGPKLRAAGMDAAGLTPAQWDARLVEVRRAIADKGWTDANLRDALALAGAQVRHLYGFDLHPEQYFAAWVLLHGLLAEMATGEGKTIVAGVAATVAGLSGLPVHVITSNDYLVERDAATLAPLLDAFGLSCGNVCQDTDEDDRRAAYARDICYVSNKQLVFDYLRDRKSSGARPSSVSARIRSLCGHRTGAPLLRGLCFAIVDEADSGLIDDAITPLILSHQAENDDDMAQAVTALSLARRLKVETHFTASLQTRRVALTRDGEQHLAEMAEGLHGKWRNRRFRNELAQQALAATHVYATSTTWCRTARWP